ncbi:MAG: hypothetical protein HPM95_14835 [Alphaproteobacteria bacterium]|nr:hypothetical protein [Alphaproteobacteria bacterium]
MHIHMSRVGTVLSWALFTLLFFGTGIAESDPARPVSVQAAVSSRKSRMRRQRAEMFSAELA